MRYVDITDVLLNTLGMAIGYKLYEVMFRGKLEFLIIHLERVMYIQTMDFRSREKPLTP